MSTGSQTDDKQARHAREITALTRREFLKRTGASGLAVAAGTLGGAAAAGASGGTPEQIHLTWGEDPATEVVVSWSTLAEAVNPRVHFGPTPAHGEHVQAERRVYTDGISGETVITYHARLRGLTPASTVHYAVTADNDARGAQPFTAEFVTAPRERRGFRFTSYGDLATPNTQWVLSSPQAKHAITAVERFAPLFHLLNGDLCYANLNPSAQPAVWRDFGNNVEPSAARRPWMPCPGNHETEFGNGPQGYGGYLARYVLPGNGTAFPGRWYRFRIGGVLFIALDANEVIHQDCGAFVNGPKPLVPAVNARAAPIVPGTALYVRGYSGGAQTRWLEATLRAARGERGIDWIIVQMHQDAMSSADPGNGSDKGIREAWLPLFDEYGVDLVLCGHDHDYERSFPVRGCHHGTGRDLETGEPVDTLQPSPVITQDPQDGVFDTTKGTIHLVLGGGGTSAPLGVYGKDPQTGTPQARVFTKRNAPRRGAAPGTFTRGKADAVEDAIWSARRDTGSAYGIGVFDVRYGETPGMTSIVVSYYHAVGTNREAPSGEYVLFEKFVLTKQRRDAEPDA